MTPVAVSTIGLIVLVLGALLLLLAVGGYVATARRQRSTDRELLKQLEAADHELAQAHAADKGWERSTLETAARQAVAERFGRDAEVQALQLVQVLDRPGVDADQAIFRVEMPDGEHRITLGRAGGVWGAV